MKVKNYLLTIVLFLPLMEYSCAGKAKEEQVESAIPVKVATVSSVKIDTDNIYLGIVEESEGTQLSFQVPGNVEQILVDPGNKVQKGQLLASLDKSRLENNYQAAQSLLNQSLDAFNRMKTMYDNNSLPEIKYIEAKSNLEQAKASASVAKKDLEDCRLYAPFSGVIGIRSIEQGTNVGAGSPVLSLLKIDKVKVKISVSEKEITKAQIGNKAFVSIEALNANYSGKIIEKGVVANPLSHTYDLKIELDNPHSLIMPGMGCNVRFSSDSLSGFILPVSAIQIAPDNRRYVWIVEDNLTIRLQPVTIGKLTSTGVAILAGIEDGDKIVVEGTQKVHEGSKVSID